MSWGEEVLFASVSKGPHKALSEHRFWVHTELKVHRWALDTARWTDAALHGHRNYHTQVFSHQTLNHKKHEGELILCANHCSTSADQSKHFWRGYVFSSIKPTPKGGKEALYPSSVPSRAGWGGSSLQKNTRDLQAEAEQAAGSRNPDQHRLQAREAACRADRPTNEERPRPAPRLLLPGPPPGCGAAGSCSSCTAGPSSRPQPGTPWSTCSPHNPRWAAREEAATDLPKARLPTARLPSLCRTSGRCYGKSGPSGNRRRSLRARSAEPGATGLWWISGQPTG